MRRNAGEGSISKRKDGRWMARFTVVMPNGTKKRMHIVKKDRDQVLTLMKKEMSLAREGTPVLHDGRKVGEWLDYWIENIAPLKIRVSTVASYKNLIKNHIKPAIGNYSLIGLSPLQVQTMINDHIKSGGSVRLAQQMKNTLSAALRSAMTRELIHRNVARLVDLPPEHKKERPLWTEAQIHEFLEKSKDHMYHPIFVMLCTYGMRRGEVLGLRWQDIDFANDAFTLSQQLIQMGNIVEFGDLKTDASHRTLPLLPHVTPLLREQQAKGLSDTLVFATRSGKPIQPSNLLRTFHTLTEKYGLPRIPLHSLRHSVATIMKDSNVAPKDAQMTLGHANIQTTMQFYQHSSLENKASALNAISSKIMFA